ncbi:MAG: sulfurtransferase TusA family protein [Candidatus Desulfatibia sp.]|uniref:sulfurtransferase TusA family protein n=1 Tax=Candidatus Desulfatibia sp. TaxID=3101189 RepID=UPI002F31B983
MSLITDNPDKTLDVKGLTCPMPALEAKLTLKAMEAGQILRLECDYKPAAEVTLPQFFKKGNVEFEIEQKGENLWVFYVKR